MAADEEQNIDDLIDYKDFESNIESENKDDSFNDDIIKIYEDHKKNFAATNKSTEIQNSQRPISKYQRSQLSSHRNGEDERMFIDAENRIENCSEKLSEEELENLFLRINKFIVRNKITRREFMENHKIYLTFGDFKELFKKIRFEISSAELNHFFNFNNDMAIEGYILGRQFLLNFKNNIKFFDQSSSDGEDIILISDDKSSSICEMTEENFEKIKLTSYKNNSKIDNKNSENLSKVKVEMEIFNKELKLLKDEIFQIVKKNENSDIPKYSSLKAKSRHPINRIKSSIPAANRNINMNYINNLSPNSKNKVPSSAKFKNNTRPLSTIKSKPLSAIPIKNIIEEKSRKRKAEDEIIKLALEKRNKESERECIKKMSEANQIAEQLDIMISYSAFMDENEGLICRVFDKIARSVSDINLKKFLFEYKKLKKLQKQNEKSKNLKSNYNTKGNDKTANNMNDEDNLFNLNRENRQRIIKDILLNSLELKIQLKSQLRILRNKKIIDPSIINSTLKLNNLDDDNISFNLQNIDFSYTLK